MLLDPKRHAVVAMQRFDPSVLPPEVAIEVEVTQSMLNRASIDEVMHVPEDLALDEAGAFEVSALRDGVYQENERSEYFPNLWRPCLRSRFRWR